LKDIRQYDNDPRVCHVWPPNFTEVYKRRIDLLNAMRSDPAVCVE